MKTQNEIWKELIKDELEENELLKIRGGDGPTEPPEDPIVK